VAEEVVTYGRVEMAINSFAPYKSPGMNGIFPVLLQEGRKVVLLQTSKQSVTFSFLFSCSEHVMNSVFFIFSLFFFCKKVKSASKDHILLTTIHTDVCKEW
jgi:hypothetical protein